MINKISGWQFERIASKVYALINNKKKHKAWFSLPSQLKSVFEMHEIDLVIDVGANKGQFAKNLRKFYSGEIMSFEPVSSVFEVLKSTAQLDQNWKVFNCAMGQEEGLLQINISENDTLSSFLSASEYALKGFNAEFEIRKENVSVIRLDDFLLSKYPDVENRKIFLKMDTQGFDKEVFMGAAKLNCIYGLLSEISIIPIYENMPNWKENIEAYQDSGYQIVGLFPVTRDSLFVLEYDCLMALPKSNEIKLQSY